MKQKKRVTQLDELDALVDRSACAMRQRLHDKHAAGYRGWKTDITTLLKRLGKAYYRGEYLNVCALSAMLYDYQQRNAQRLQP